MTTLVPTMNAALAHGHSTVWCGSFELAWQQLAREITKGPVRLENETLAAQDLRESTFSERALETQAWYATAGFGRDRVVEEITKELERRFPDAELPSFTVGEDDILTFAYLSLALQFDIHYADNPIPLTFRDSQGGETSNVSPVPSQYKESHKPLDLAAGSVRR